MGMPSRGGDGNYRLTIHVETGRPPATEVVNPGGARYDTCGYMVAQRGFAASGKRSAFSDQLLDQGGEHPFDFGHVRRQLLMINSISSRRPPETIVAPCKETKIQ